MSTRTWRLGCSGMRRRLTRTAGRLLVGWVGEVWKFDPSGGDRVSEHIGLSGETVGVVPVSSTGQALRPFDGAQDRQAQDERSSRRYLGTAMVSPVHMTVDTAEKWIGALIDDLDTDPQKYELAAAVRHGEPLYGHDLLRRWQEKAASFPDRLAVKLVQQNLWLGPWFNWNAYVARSDHLGRSPAHGLDAAGHRQRAGGAEPRVPAVDGAQSG